MADGLCRDSRSDECTAAESESYRLILVDPAPLRREALKRLLEGSAAKRTGGDFSVVGAVPSLNQANADSSVRLVVISPPVTACETTQPIRFIQESKRLFPCAAVVVVSDRSNVSEVIASLRAGARGFITADIDPILAFYALTLIVHGGVFFPPQILLDCLVGSEDADMRVIAGPTSASEAAIGLTSLTTRQKKVLQLLRQGQSNKRIAIELNMCESTVKVHVREIMRKLKVTNRTQAALCAANIDFPNNITPNNITLEPLLAQQNQADSAQSDTRLVPA